jgi:hypothetical protein
MKQRQKIPPTKEQIPKIQNVPTEPKFFNKTGIKLLTNKVDVHKLKVPREFIDSPAT